MNKDKLSFFTSRTFFMGITISYLFSLCGTSFWIADIFGMFLGIIVLLLVKKTNQSTIVKFIIGFVFALISLIVLVNMGHTLYLRKTPLTFMSAFAIIGALIISSGKMTSLKRIAYLFFIYSLILFIFKILGLVPHIKVINLFPMFNTNINNILLGSVVYMLISVVPILSLNEINDKKNLILTYIVASITIFTVSFLAISVLGLKEVQLYRYPEYVMLKKINFLNFVSNVDNFFNFAIILDLLFTISLGIKNMSGFGKTVKYIALVFLFILTVYVCNRCDLLIYLYENLPYIFIILLIILLFPKK